VLACVCSAANVNSDGLGEFGESMLYMWCISSVARVTYSKAAPLAASVEPNTIKLCSLMFDIQHAQQYLVRKKDLSRFLHRTKDNLAAFSEKKNGC